MAPRSTKKGFLNQLYGGIDEPELKRDRMFVCKLRKTLCSACGGENYIEARGPAGTSRAIRAKRRKPA